MEEVCFQKVKESVLAGNQCMIFVHSRKDTTITATHWDCPIKKSRGSIWSIHHAGMLHQDRNIIEKLFLEGHINVLVCPHPCLGSQSSCTHSHHQGHSTLWPETWWFCNLGMLNVMQIFGCVVDFSLTPVVRLWLWMDYPLTLIRRRIQITATSNGHCHYPLLHSLTFILACLWSAQQLKGEAWYN